MKYKRILLSLFSGFIVYSFIWYYIAEDLHKKIESQINQLQEKGYIIKYNDLSLKGYPFNFKISLTNPSIKASYLIDSKINGKLILTSSIWRPYHIHCTGKGQHTTLFLEGFIAAKGSGLKAHFPILSPEGLSIEYKELAFKALLEDKKLLSIENLKINSPYFDKDSLARSQLDLQADSIRSSFLEDFPLGPVIKNLKFQGIFQGSTEGETLRDKVQSWFNSNGAVEMPRLAFHWGETLVESEGTISLDEELQPVAAFAISVEGIESLLATLVKTEAMTKKTAEILRMSLNIVLPSLGILTDDPVKKLSITLQDRTVLIGSFPLMQIPYVDWDVPFKQNN